MIIDDGMNKGVAKEFVTAVATADAGSRRGILGALGTSNEAPTATNGDVAELLYVDMKKCAGMSCSYRRICSRVRISMCDSRFSPQRTNTA